MNELLSQFSASSLIANLIFSAIGFVGFVFGKRMNRLKPMLIGLALMVFPYFVSGTAALYTIGLALTAALFLFRD